MREYSTTFTVNDQWAAGDIHVSGFATRNTAVRIGMRVLDALRAEYPDAEIRVSIDKVSD